MGMSPQPVRKITGIRMPERFISRCNSRPVMPGMLTARTTHPASAPGLLFRNSVADVKACTGRPIDSISAPSPSRTETSSSIKKMVSFVCPPLVARTSRCRYFDAIGLLHRHRQLEFKCCAAVWVIGACQLAAVRRNDVPADRKSHAHPLRLGGKERVKQTFRPLGIESGTGVPHCDCYSFRGMEMFGANRQHPRSVSNSAPKLSSVTCPWNVGMIGLNPATTFACGFRIDSRM